MPWCKPALILLAAGILYAPAEESPAPEDRDVEVYHGMADRKTITVDEPWPGLKTALLLEGEGFRSRQGDEETSDLVLATFQFNAEAELTDRVAARLVLLWEEDDTEPLDLDEAVLAIRHPGNEAWFAEVGRMYVPFGAFNSHFVSDPLTLELGETHESAVLAGYDDGRLALCAAVFNGEADDGGEDRIDGAVATLDLRVTEGFHGGVYWMSDLGESDALRDIVSGEDYRDAGALGGHVTLIAGPLHLDGEILGALATMAWTTGGEDHALVNRRPMAWNAEAAWIFNEAWEAALKIEGADDFDERPARRFGGVVTWAFREHATLKLEYLRGEYGGEEDADTVTTQLAIAF